MNKYIILFNFDYSRGITTIPVGATFGRPFALHSVFYLCVKN